MNPANQQLLTDLLALTPAPGAAPESLRDLVRAQAATFILADPGEAQVPPGDLDPALLDAIQAGAAQAAALAAAGVSLRLAVEILPAGTAVADQAERPSAIFGPFVDKLGTLQRFLAFETSKFQSLHFRQGGGVPVSDAALLIPAASTGAAPGLRSWTLPAGTVWIGAQFLVAGASGFAGVRIAGGTLELAADALLHGGITVPVGTPWTLSVELEQPPPAAGAGVDADGLSLRLPERLEVHSNAPAVLSGDALLSGFGSDLTLTPAGAATVNGNQISFPMKAAEPQWSISGNRSPVTQFEGEGAPRNPRWSIPISTRFEGQIGEAASGGSIVFGADVDFTSTVTGQSGTPFRWFASTLSFDAEQIEIQSVQPHAGASFDLSLWDTSVTKLRMAGQPLRKLLFRSERGGFDTIAVFGGSCSNLWDRPRRADGEAFEFEGAIDSFALFSAGSGLLTNLLASATAAPKLSGFALENLYLLVRSPQSIAVNATFNVPLSAPAGAAVLFFDVNMALPILPDPYAANLVPPSVDTFTQKALRVALVWTDAETPAMEAHLDAAVRFPEPRFAQFDDPDERAVYNTFREHLQSQVEFLYLLDLSSRDHLFGVAFESPSDHTPEIVENRLSVQLNRIRLLMQPQVQWEPVQIEPNPDVPQLVEEIGRSTQNGGPTLLGANSVKLVPVLAAPLSDEILEAIGNKSPAAALFSLPFGIRATALLDLVSQPAEGQISPAATDTSINEPMFGELTSARQIRLLARERGFLVEEPARVMPGLMRQRNNLAGNASKLGSVMPNDASSPLSPGVDSLLALHRVDLSGYGLSTVSEWHQDADLKLFTKVEFRVFNGRTAYEVVQFHSILYECGARVVREVILERHNSGRVFRVDTGWVALEAGTFTRPNLFQKGAVQSFENIRRIRIIGDIIDLGSGFKVQPVIFDADAAIDGALGGRVPIYDRPGYVDIETHAARVDPKVSHPPDAVLQLELLKRLYARVNAISGPVDCAVRVAGTLEAQISSIVSDAAPDDGGGTGFAVAVVGAPKLPRAGQWTVVRIDPGTHEAMPVDQHRGVPLVRNGADGFRFREPADTRRKSASVEYALLMATDTSRALFRQPFLDPAQKGTLRFDLPPLLADPYSMVQSTGSFPRPNFGITLDKVPSFTITPDDLWKIGDDVFAAAGSPLPDFVKGGGWGMTRDYEAGPITLGIDSAAAAAYNVAIPPSVLHLELPDPLGNILQIRTQYENVAGGLSKLAKPDLIFLGALQDLKDTLDSLAHLLGLPFDFDVSITAGSGANPSFVVHMQLFFRIGDGPDGRVEIGIGKFYGQFLVRGALEASLQGVEDALLFVEFQGDVQQGILPPLLYAGGLFRFSIELHESGAPTIQLTLGMVISIGGDLIPGLLAVEVTVKYAYSLIPETLSPGILLGLEARAKLLGGLIGFSFSVEAMARVQRKNAAIVTVFAQIRITATIQVAIFFDEDVDFETQFHQEIPLAALGLIPGAGMVVLAASAPL